MSDDDSSPSGMAERGEAAQAAGGVESFDEIPALVDGVQPSVVSILTPTSQGSGVIYRENGFVLTNHHVVGESTEAVVVLASGERLTGRVQASTELYDLALVKVDRDGLPAATFAKALPDVGELALAMGNPLGFENTVTAGIVSGLHRDIPAAGATPALLDLIQTDAPISPGNSGGGLVDADGEVMGINVAYLPPTEGAVSLGFAIPAPIAVRVADELIATGRVDFAYLGIRPQQVTPELNEAFDLGTATGILVTEVVQGGPADKAGVKAGDVIVRMDDRDLATIEDLFAELRDHEPESRVPLTIKRGGDEREVEVELGHLPERSSRSYIVSRLAPRRPSVSKRRKSPYASVA